ncbi:hypothetical protein BDF22DRAFT_743591 [Syncephalis plumigaleata]|nr:hypothetical protein BDF22DRAFT_743591 [Syncephalis plumigaleata]
MFEAFSLAAVLLSAAILLINRLHSYVYGHVSYSRVSDGQSPSNDPFKCEVHDDNWNELDADESTFEVASVFSSTTHDRLDYTDRIRRMIKRINTDANLAKMFGSMIALSASVWGILWQLLMERNRGHQHSNPHHGHGHPHHGYGHPHHGYGHPHHGYGHPHHGHGHPHPQPHHRHYYHHDSYVYFSAINACLWFYITLLSIANMRYRKQHTSSPQIVIHQTILIAIAYCGGWIDFITRYSTGILTVYIRETQCTLIILLGAHIAAIGLLWTRGKAETTASGRLKSLESSASIYEWCFVSWMSPIMADGAKKPLGNSDMWELPESSQTSPLIKRYEYYNHNRAFGTYGLFIACWPQLAKQFVYSILWSIVTFGVPIFFYLLLQDLSSVDARDSKAWLYLAGMFISMILCSILFQLCCMAGQCAGLQFKSIMSNEIFKMCLKQHMPITKHDDNNAESTDTTSNGKSNSSKWDKGAVTNLLGSDANMFHEAIANLHALLGGILQVIIGCTLIWYIVGEAILFTLLAILFYTCANFVVMRLSPGLIFKRQTAIGKRLSLVNEMLQSIRVVKLFSWEQQSCARIDEAREAELRAIWVNFCNFCIFAVLSSIAPVLITVATLGSYTLWYGNKLEPTTAFTCIALLESLRTAMSMLPDSVFFTIQYVVIMRRIKQFLSGPTVDTESERLHPAAVPASSDRIGFINGKFAWKINEDSQTQSRCSDTSTEHSVFTLKELDVEFKVGKLNVVAGPTGSGKTSLLLALLGEMPRIEGRILLPRPRRHVNAMGVACSDIGYVAQQAWLQNSSIRDNILFGQPYDERRYQQVLYACALERDLEILDAGDRTQVGEKGVVLSGGQKQRVALARAVYGPAQHVLFDDCLSAVDAHTARHIVQHCLSGPLMDGRTRILVTHHVDICISIAEFAVLLNAGQIVASGDPDTVLSSLIGTSSHSGSDSDSEKRTHASGKHHRKESKSGGKLMQPVKEQANVNNTGILVEEEISVNGSVSLQIYKNYFRAGGYRFWALPVISYLLFQLAVIMQAYWIVVWTQDSLERSDRYYVHVYIWFTVVVVIFAISSPLLSCRAGLRSARALFRDMIHRVAYASIRFLDKTPMGRIMNRFSKDMYELDTVMGFVGQYTLSSGGRMLFQLLIVGFIMPQFFIAIIAAIAAYCIVGSYYLKTNRNMISGAVTVRAFGMQQWFSKQNIHRINNMQRPFYLKAGATQWITCRTQVISAVFTLLATTCFIWKRDQIGVDVVGFTLSYVLGFLTSAATTIQYYTKADMVMNSVERIDDYLSIEQEPPAIIEDNRPPHNWPEKGQIDVNNISIRYAEDQSPVIHNLSFSVKPGERIGAGKSTISLAFFRFVEPFIGNILIDGVDISKIGLRDLRSRLTIIPQDPVLFNGTIRSNLDPFSMHDDAALWNALRRAHLIDTDVNAEKPAGLEHLDAPIAENGGNFSHGQRQLLSMARALLRNSRLIIMDEATASIDFDTDAKIQETIREEFKNSTLLCVAHRLRTIIDYDRVMVLDAGHLVEFDAPGVLIKQPNSMFRNLCEQSGELDLLLSLSQAAP